MCSESSINSKHSFECFTANDGIDAIADFNACIQKNDRVSSVVVASKN